MYFFINKLLYKFITSVVQEKLIQYAYCQNWLVLAKLLYQDISLMRKQHLVKSSPMVVAMATLITLRRIMTANQHAVVSASLNISINSDKAAV